jgi:hypothetical protein
VGEPLAHVHARDETSAEEASRQVLAAYELGVGPVPQRPVLLEVIG